MRALAAALLLGAAAVPAGAWGPKGHAIVAAVAQDRLSPRARAAVGALLGPGVDLVAISDCADRIRDGHEPVRCGSFEVAPDSATAPWHVIGIPLASRPDAAAVDADCAGDCVLSAIAGELAALTDRAASRPRRRLALMYLVHFAGDLHQPLHCALDDAPVAYRRRFGNTRVVQWRGRPQRLHHFWDQLLRTGDEARAVEPLAYARDLERSLSPQDAVAWTSGDFLHAAALESFTLARDDVYAPLTRSHDVLSPQERRRQLALADRRLSMAGVRLAAWLERAFAAR